MKKVIKSKKKTKSNSLKKKELYEKFMSFKGDQVIGSIIDSYFGDNSGFTNRNKKRKFASIDIIKKNDQLLLKFLKNIVITKDTINKLNYASIGNISVIIQHCPTQNVVTKYKKLMNKIIDILVE